MTKWWLNNGWYHLILAISVNYSPLLLIPNIDKVKVEHVEFFIVQCIEKREGRERDEGGRGWEGIHFKRLSLMIFRISSIKVNEAIWLLARARVRWILSYLFSRLVSEPYFLSRFFISLSHLHFNELFYQWLDTDTDTWEAKNDTHTHTHIVSFGLFIERI